MNKQLNEEKREKVNEHRKSCLASLALREMSIFHIQDWQNFEKLPAPKAKEGAGELASGTHCWVEGEGCLAACTNDRPDPRTGK